jgi:hypothetical protein
MRPFQGGLRVCKELIAAILDINSSTIAMKSAGDCHWQRLALAIFNSLIVRIGFTASVTSVYAS